MKTGKISSLLLGLVLIFTLFFTGLWSEVAISSEGDMAIEYLYELCKEYYQDGRYQEAINCIKKILLIDPDDKEAQRWMSHIERTIASARMAQEVPPELKAREKKLKAQRIAEEKTREYYLQGKDYYRHHQYEQAIAQFLKALAFNPNYTRASKYIEKCKKKLRKAREEELKAKEKELRAKEKELKARKEELKARTEELKTEKMVVKETQKELQAKRKLSEEKLLKYHYNLALSYDRSYRYEEAVAEYEKALEITPDDPDTHYNLAIIYDDQLEDKGKAIEHYQRYLELHPTTEDAEEVAEWIRKAREEIEWGK